MEAKNKVVSASLVPRSLMKEAFASWGRKLAEKPKKMVEQIAGKTRKYLNMQVAERYITSLKGLVTASRQLLKKRNSVNFKKLQ